MISLKLIGPPIPARKNLQYYNRNPNQDKDNELIEIQGRDHEPEVEHRFQERRNQ